MLYITGIYAVRVGFLDLYRTINSIDSSTKGSPPAALRTRRADGADGVVYPACVLYITGIYAVRVGVLDLYQVPDYKSY